VCYINCIGAALKHTVIVASTNAVGAVTAAAVLCEDRPSDVAL